MLTVLQSIERNRLAKFDVYVGDIMAKNSLDETRAIKVLISQIRAFCETMHDILHNANTEEIGRYSSYKDMACIYNDFAE